MSLAEPLPKVENSIIIEIEAKNLKHLISVGYVFLAASLFVYGIEEFVGAGGEDNAAITVFFLHYFLALTYTGLLLYNRSLGVLKSWKAEHIDKTIILFNLFLISAYALNRVVPVFENSTVWLCVYLIISSAAILSFRYFNTLPKVANKLQYVLIGSALTLYIYLTLYSAKFFPISGIGIIVFGIGAHILVPIFLFFGSIALIRYSRKEKTISYGWIASGIIVTMGIAAAFITEWNIRIKAIEKTSNVAVLNTQSELPTWVELAQTVSDDWITERILKSNLVYTVASDHGTWNFFPSGLRWNESRKHDPLVFLASLTRKSTLSSEDRIAILKAITQNRHNAEERLWSGENLTTSYVVTDADIYPELRLAYTENYFTIRNTLNANRAWQSTQEALYTFQLPEGSVVTSLSLWVKGVEEKAILTSKQKATTAYNTIVGVEQRDPSVVHWQEGNTVTVRVFPCTPDEERKFKIGITSPLPEENGRLSFKGITFRGPNADEAPHTLRIRFIGNPEDLDISNSFEKNEKGEYLTDQEYDPDLGVTFKSTPVKANRFSFAGFSYSLSECKPAFRAIKFSRLYLDVNNTWTKEELSDLKPALSSHKFYAYVEDQFIEINEDNWTDLTSSLLKNNFSIFPFHHLTRPEESLVISKGKSLSPFLADFKNSDFEDGISKFFGSKKKVYVYNISSSASTYIRSLKELRALEFASGSVEELNELLHRGQFPVTPENDRQIVIHDAKLLITKKPVEKGHGNDNAPDHLARLFAYNHIMRQVGSHFFTKDFINEKLVNEASSAYVVSPVSSLIVLETKEDYERFGITDRENSLHNASKQSSGAVPEPHEWALIILFAGIVLYCFCKQRNKFAGSVE